jgi:hypothetical protein
MSYLKRVRKVALADISRAWLKDISDTRKKKIENTIQEPVTIEEIDEALRKTYTLSLPQINAGFFKTNTA